jgi:hypothetical protein
MAARKLSMKNKQPQSRMFSNGMMVNKRASRRNRCRNYSAALRNGRPSKEIISGFS